MQINFQVKRFNSTIYKLIRSIYHKAHQGENILDKNLEDLRHAFIEYYENERGDYTGHEKSERADEVYSQFLQNLFDYCSHNIKDEQYVNKLFESILYSQDNYFFYKSYFDKNLPNIITWQNPTEKNNVLHSLCRGNYPEVIGLILKKLKTILSENQYKNFLNCKDKSGFSILNSAASFGNVDTCKLLLEEAYILFKNDSVGFNVFLTQTDNYKFNPLLSACKAGNFKVVELLLKVAVIYKFSLFDSVVSIPAWEDLEEKLTDDIYLNHREHIQNLKNMLAYDNNEGYTPLISACKHENLGTLNELLVAASIIYKKDRSAYKKFLCIQNKHGFSALLTAVEVNCFNVVEKLLNEAEKVFHDDPQAYKNFLVLEERNGNFALNLACNKGNLNILNRLLLSIFSLSQILLVLKNQQVRNQENATQYDSPIMLNRQEEGIKQIRNIFLKQNKFGYSLLISACNKGHLAIVKQLLAIAILNSALLEDVLLQENNDGYSPLISACKEGHLEVVKEILKVASGENQLLQKVLSQKNKLGFTAITSACSDGYLDIVISLIQIAVQSFKDKPNFLKNFLLEKNTYGFSPIISATKGGSTEIVKVLIKFTFYIYGYSDLFNQVAEHYQNDFSFKALSELDDLHEAGQLVEKDLSGLKCFLLQQNYQQYSALNTAASENFFDIVHLLLITARVVYRNDPQEFNQFLEQKNNFGFTPLNVAVKKQAKKIAEKLYAEGADPDIVNTSGFTARTNMPKDWHLFGHYTSPSSMSSAPSRYHTRLFSHPTNLSSNDHSIDRRIGNKKRKFDDSTIQFENPMNSEDVRGRYKITRRY